MKFYLFSILFILSICSCRTAFEQIRTSGDAERMYNEANRLFEEGDYNRAIILYELIVPSYRGRAEAEQMYFNYADANYRNGSYLLSSHYFKTFADTYTTSKLREEALFKSAYSYYLLSPRYKLDQEDSKKAIDAFQLFANSYPNSDKLDQCNEYIDELREKMEIKAFEAGRLYYHLNNYNSAIQSFENVLKDFPGTPRQEEALYLIAKSSFELAINSIFTVQEERFRKTIQRAENFLKKFPSSEYASEVIKYRDESQQELNKIQNG